MHNVNFGVNFTVYFYLGASAWAELSACGSCVWLSRAAVSSGKKFWGIHMSANPCKTVAVDHRDL